MLEKIFLERRSKFIHTLFRSERPGDIRLTACPVSTFQTRMASEEPVTINSPELCQHKERMRPKKKDETKVVIQNILKLITFLLV